MKLAGRKISGANIETIVIPRGDGEPLVFRAQAVLDHADFDALCPAPKAPSVLEKGGTKRRNTEDPRYIEAMNDWSAKRGHWTVLTSLRNGTPDLEWETVTYSDPNTWGNYESELRDAGLNEIEVGLIVRGVLRANSLDEAKLDEARANFLRSQRQPVEG